MTESLALREKNKLATINPPLLLRKTIAFARAVFADTSILAEMSEVLNDTERQAILVQLAPKSSDPKSPTDNADSTNGESNENQDDDIIMEDPSKSANKVSLSQQSRSPSILRPTKRTPNSGRGGNVSQEVLYKGTIHAIRSHYLEETSVSSTYTSVYYEI